jgi:hypothetical protein
MYNSYRDWCSENGEKPVTQNNLSREVRARLGVAESSNAGFRMFIGVELLKAAPPQDVSISEMFDAIHKDKDEYWK